MSSKLLTKDSARPLLFLGTALVLSIGFIVGSMQVRAHYQGEIDEAMSSLSLNKRRISQARVDLQTLAQYQPSYAQLVALKVIGDEPRLDWTELLEQSASAVNISSVRFEIGQRAAYQDAQLPPEFATLPLFKSRMTLNLSLKHEVQLLDFFKDMSQRSNGYFVIDSCVMQADGQHEGQLSQLQARCELDWLTLNFATPAGGEVFNEQALGQL